MRLLVEGFAAIGLQVGYLLDVAREIVEAFGPHEKTVGHFRQPRESEGLRQLGAVGEGRSVMITVATLGIESAAFCEGFEKRGLAATVFADEERDVGPKS